MTRKIRILEDHVANQIAAGEVVERPASVLKELIENALDAGADTIDVVLQDGGCSRIGVRDNGHGMSEHDALLAIERHGTSKLRSAADLKQIRTLGFRGEALPSIAAVSRFRLTTRRAEDEVGVRVELEGGVLGGVAPLGAPIGTSVEVRNLFFNVPARLAFLRTAQTELDRCLDTVRKLALCRPQVSFVVRHDGRERLMAPACLDPLERVAAILPAVRSAEWVAVDALGEASLCMKGWVAAPSAFSASAAKSLHLFVNRRHVQDPTLRRAVLEAYRDLLPHGKRPFGVLLLSIDPEHVDVNVHPAKAEVRFRSPSVVAEVATRAVRTALLSAGTPVYRASNEADDGAHLQLSLSVEEPRDAEVPGGAVDSSSETPPLPVAPPQRSTDPHPSDVLPEDAGRARRVEALIGCRYAVLADDAGYTLVDAGRLRCRVAAALAAGDPTPCRLLAPEVVALDAASLARFDAVPEALEALGTSVVAFSGSQLAVRALPRALSAFSPAEVFGIAWDALSRKRDVVGAWGASLTPPPIRGRAEVEALCAQADDLGVSIGPSRPFDPARFVGSGMSRP